MKKRMAAIAAALLISCAACPILAFADEVTVDDILQDLQTVAPAASASGGSEAAVPEVSVTVESPLYVVDDGAVYYVDEVAPIADYGSVYPGTWTGSILDYFAGVVRKHPGTHYVAFRADQHNYYCYYSADLTSSGNVVQGSAPYLHYQTSTNYGSSSLTRGEGSISVDCSHHFVYTDLIDSCAELEGVIGVTWQTILALGAVAALGLWLISRILWRGVR